jgi:hypothetical protein
MKRLFTPFLFLLISCVSLIPARAQEVTVYYDVDTDFNVVWNQGYIAYQPTDGCQVCQDGEFRYDGIVQLWDSWGHATSCSWGPDFYPADQAAFEDCDPWLSITTLDMDSDQGFFGNTNMNIFCENAGFYLASIVDAATPTANVSKASYQLDSCYNTNLGAAGVWVPYGNGCPGKCSVSSLPYINVGGSCPWTTPYLQVYVLVKNGMCQGKGLTSGPIPYAGTCSK